MAKDLAEKRFYKLTLNRGRIHNLGEFCLILIVKHDE
jgi:hypothetical protein